MKYSVIIPTMWAKNDYLLQMLDKYEKSPLVKEVLIIDNHGQDRIELPFKKVVVLGSGINIYVNPAWALGVRNAACEKIVIVNDDILIDDFDELINMVDADMVAGDAIFAGDDCFDTNTLSKSKFIEIAEHPHPKFGVIFFMHRKFFRDIPHDLKIYYGDVFQLRKNTGKVFRGVKVKTQMSTTIKKFDFYKMILDEQEIYKEKYQAELNKSNKRNQL